MRAHLLGSGGAISTVERGNTSFAVSTAKLGAVLIDCSGNPAVQLLRAGIDPMLVCEVFVTHRHADHLYGLLPLVFENYVQLLQQGGLPRPPLTVRGPQTALDVVAQLLEAGKLRGRDDMFELRLEPLPTGEEHVTRLGELVVTTFPVVHGEVETLGVKVDRAAGEPSGRAVVFSADTEPCRSVLDQSRGAALLFHECSSLEQATLAGHTTLAQLDEVVGGTTAERIVLVHLPPLAAGAETALKLDLAARFGDRVVLGEDGLRFDVPR